MARKRVKRRRSFIKQGGRSKRRWMIVGFVAIALVGVLLGAEGLLRTAIAPRIEEAAPDDVDISLSGSAVWGLLSGDIGVTVTADESLITGSLSETVNDIWIDDQIHLTVTRDTPIGELPIELTLIPIVEGGQLSMNVVAVTANGLNLPPELVDPADAVARAPLGDGCMELRDAAVDDGLLILEGSIPIGLDGSATC